MHITLLFNFESPYPILLHKTLFNNDDILIKMSALVKETLGITVLDKDI